MTWRSYAGPIDGDGNLWNTYQADSPIYYSPDWKADVISPPAQFLSDVAAGTLANVTWITPTFETSDHPGIERVRGTVVGYEHRRRDRHEQVLEFDGDLRALGRLGRHVRSRPARVRGLRRPRIRIPLIVISPYAKKAGVTHTQYETASVLRFIEDNFGLARLNKADARANDPANDATVFNFQQRPRKFKQIAGSKPAAYWLHEQLRTERRQVPKTILGDD